MTQVYQEEERRPSPLRNFRANSLNLIPKTCPSRLRSSLNFYSSQVSNMLTLGLSAHSSRSRTKRNFSSGKLRAAIRKSSNWGDFLKRLEQMYPVYETDLSTRTEIEELPSHPEFPTSACISEFVAQLEELMGRMNPTSCGPTEPHLWLTGKIPPKTWDDCRETSERKARRHYYDDLVDLLIELAMERENDSHMHKYLHKHLRRETPAEKNPGGRSPHPHCNPGKGRGGQLKHMTETPPPRVKGPLIFCTVVLRTIRVVLATRPTVMGEMRACSN